MSSPRLFSLGIALTLALAAPALAPTPVRAQDEVEREEAGRSRGGRAWGEESLEQGQGEGAPPTHHYGQVFATVGVGGTVRILAHASVCDPGIPGLESCRFSPPYLQLRGGWFFEGDGDLQHGVGLGIATNLSADGQAIGIDAGAQWTLAPAYHIRYWFDSWLQLMGHVGVPLSFSSVSDLNTGGSTTEFNWGLELQIGLVVKFLTGIGAYVAGNGALFFAGDGLVWPTISGEIGAMFEYEVLP